MTNIQKLIRISKTSLRIDPPVSGYNSKKFSRETANSCLGIRKRSLLSFLIVSLFH